MTDGVLLDELLQLNYTASYIIGVENKEENKMVEFHFKCGNVVHAAVRLFFFKM